jgi:DNA-binding NarL/FixJ family response regulator
MAEGGEIRPDGPVRVLVAALHPVLRAGLSGVLRKARMIRLVGESGMGDGIPALASARRAGVVVLAGCPDDTAALRELRSLKERLPRVSAILLTAIPTTEGLLRAVGLGCSGYLPLSVTGRALARAVLQVAGGECAFESGLLQRLLERMGPRALGRAQETTALLTRPERDVLSLIVEGLTNHGIAERLRWPPGTVKDYVQRVIEKLEVSDRTQAAVKAVRLGLVP